MYVYTGVRICVCATFMVFRVFPENNSQYLLVTINVSLSLYIYTYVISDI